MNARRRILAASLAAASFAILGPQAFAQPDIAGSEGGKPGLALEEGIGAGEAGAGQGWADFGCDVIQQGGQARI